MEAFIYSAALCSFSDDPFENSFGIPRDHISLSSMTIFKEGRKLYA